MNIFKQVAAAAVLFLATLAIPCGANSADGQKIAAFFGPQTNFGSSNVVTSVNDERDFLGCAHSEDECAQIAGNNGYGHYSFVHEHRCEQDHDSCYGFND